MSNTKAISPAKEKLTAKQFIQSLKKLQSPAELEKIKRYFKQGAEDPTSDDRFIGVRMGEVFELARQHIDMECSEIALLLESPFHEARTGAVSIMDFQARHKKTTPERRKELFDLYISRHDRINNWDLVDRAAPYVIGGYLYDKPRTLLYKLAVSANIWERRTAIVSTYFFIRKGDTADTFTIAGLLLNDKEDLIHKACGGWIRQAGTKDRQKLIDFLDQYAALMPRTMLRYAIEHFDKELRDHYLSLKKKQYPQSLKDKK